MKKKIKMTTHCCNYLFLLMALFIVVPGLVFCGEYTGHCSLTTGGFYTDHKFSTAFDIDRQTEIGISFDIIKKNWLISLALDTSFFYAESEKAVNQYNLNEKKKIEFFRSDTYLGIKKIVNLSSVVKPFISSGVYLARIYGKHSDAHEIVAGLGYWLGAGVYFDLPKNLTVGFLWKRSKADVKSFDIKSNVGGNHFSLITGFHF